MGSEFFKPDPLVPPIVMLGQPEEKNKASYIDHGKIEITIFPDNCTPDDVWRAVNFLTKIESKL